MGAKLLFVFSANRVGNGGLDMTVDLPSSLPFWAKHGITRFCRIDETPTLDSSENHFLSLLLTPDHENEELKSSYFVRPAVENCENPLVWSIPSRDLSNTSNWSWNRSTRHRFLELEGLDFHSNYRNNTWFLCTVMLSFTDWSCFVLNE